MQYYHLAMITHPSTGDVLATQDNKLPTIFHDEHSFDMLYKLCKSMEKIIGHAFQLILLRTDCEAPVSTKRDSIFIDYRAKLLVFEIVSRILAEPPKGFKWLPANQVASICVEEPELSSVKKFLYDYERVGLTKDEDCLYPYSIPGWFTEASEWIHDVLDGTEYDISEIHQVSSKSEGCVLRAKSSSGSILYFKEAGPNVFHDELQVTLALSEAMPNLFPAPIAVNKESKRILMRDSGATFSETACSVTTNPSLFRSILTDWGIIQRRSVLLRKQLENEGLPVFDNAYMDTLIRDMVSDFDWQQVVREEIQKREDHIFFDEVAFRDIFFTYASQLCERISQFNVPLTLVHGDFSPVNITSSEIRQFGYIDFGSTAISFPFRDAYTFANICNASEGDIDFYFELWTEYEDEERLRELYALMAQFQLVLTTLVFYKQHKTTEESSRGSNRSAFCIMLGVLLENFANERTSSL